MNVRMAMWPHACDNGLGTLVLDRECSPVTTKGSDISLKWYCSGTKAKFQKLLVKHGPCSDVRCNPPGHQPIPA